jgi:hypothetical protein
MVVFMSHRSKKTLLMSLNPGASLKSDRTCPLTHAYPDTPAQHTTMVHSTWVVTHDIGLRCTQYTH